MSHLTNPPPSPSWAGEAQRRPLSDPPKHPTHIYPNHMLPRFLLFALCAFVSANPGKAADRPNIVIFFTDDQGTLDAGCYGSDDIDTPAIDDLAASGVRFTQAYAHVVCCPSCSICLGTSDCRN